MNPRSINDITVRILAGLRERLQDSWDTLDDADRGLIISCAADAAKLQLRALAAPQTPDAQLLLFEKVM
jgi:hypothetical protein